VIPFLSTFSTAVCPPLSLPECSKMLEDSILMGKSLQNVTCDSSWQWILSQEAFSAIFMVPTVPRSGSGWIRALIARALGDGVVHLSAYRQENILENHLGSFASAASPDNSSHCSATLLEQIEEERISQRKLMFKTHYPALPLCQLPSSLKDMTSSSLFFIVHLIRNPFSNFMALRRFDTEGFFSDSFLEFMQIWAFHHKQTADLGVVQRIPTFTVTYEDICQSPSQFLEDFRSFMDSHSHPRPKEIRRSKKRAGLFPSPHDVNEEKEDGSFSGRKREWYLANAALLKHPSRKQNIFDEFLRDLVSIGSTSVQWAYEKHGEIMIKYGFDQLLCKAFLTIECGSTQIFESILYQKLPSYVEASASTPVVDIFR